MFRFLFFMRYYVIMINVITQNAQHQWRIEWFKLNHIPSTGWWEMIGMARIDLEHTDIVRLGSYKYYKQAIEVFASMDYIANDIMYYRSHSQLYQLPPAIIDEQTCLQVYGSLY